MNSPNPSDPSALTSPGKTEFVLLVSLVMMIVAVTIDAMLPALPAIGGALNVSSASDQGLVIASFLAGFGVAQLFVGIMADRYGRRRVMLWSLIGFVAASLLASTASSFDAFLAARALQGVLAAGARVAVMSMVRDRYEGREMAQVMSLAGMLFMAAPVLAPLMGQSILLFGSWRWIFAAFAVIGLVILIWTALRMPETLKGADQIPIAWTPIIASMKIVAMDRLSLGYSLAMTVLSCALFGFLMTVQPIFDQSFGRADLLPTGFAVMASGMAIASLLNASIVRRFGMRLIGHAALFWFTGIAAIHAFLSYSGHESLETFIGLQTLMMIGFALVGGNFGAMAMENMGPVAGMASSLQGFIANVVGAVAGALIARAFDGTTGPLYLACLISGVIALGIVLVTERGRFFVAHHAPDPGVL